MAEDPIEIRMRVIESRTDVHEAVCAERYKGLAAQNDALRRDLGLRLNIAIGGIGIILTAIAAGDPLVNLIKKMAGG